MFEVYAKNNNFDFGFLNSYKTEEEADAAIEKCQEFDAKTPEYFGTVYTIVEKGSRND